MKFCFWNFLLVERLLIRFGRGPPLWNFGISDELNFCRRNEVIIWGKSVPPYSKLIIGKGQVFSTRSKWERDKNLDNPPQKIFSTHKKYLDNPSQNIFTTHRKISWQLTAKDIYNPLKKSWQPTQIILTTHQMEGSSWWCRWTHVLWAPRRWCW